VACEPLWLKVEAPPDPVQHGPCNGDLSDPAGARALGVEDDPGFVVDEIIGVVSEKRISVLPCNPSRLRVGQRHLFRRLTSAAPIEIVIISAVLLTVLGGIQSRQILADRAGRFLDPRPGNWLIARRPLLLVHVRLDQARIDRKSLAANQASRNALRHHALKY